MEQNEFVEIKCPLPVINKQRGIHYTCGRLCVKVLPGSKGEAYCTRHKTAFEFEVNDQSTPSTKIRVQKDESDQERDS